MRSKMPPFYRINGDWFHSRSSSNYGELQSVRALVAASRKAEYCGLKWSSGRGQEPRLYQFGGEVGVQPSTMQTKIRAMIRYGFVQESEHCPLRWTRLGRLWSDLVNVGNEEAAQDIYRFTLVHALAFFAFNERGYAKTLNGVFFPLRELLRKTREGRIAEKDFRCLVDGATQRTGKNESYWRTDLLNSGMFEVTSGFLTVSPRFGELAEAIKSYPFERMSDDEWREFRANQLWEKGPFKETLGELLLSVNRPKTADEVILIPLENAFAETLDISIAEQESDLLKNPQTKTLTVLQRSAAWSRLVKGRYDSKCVLRGCDVHGSPFVEAAHIKAHAAKKSKTPHHSHILNGLCLCRNCHGAFDDGLFSLNDGAAVMVSEQVGKLREQHPRRVIEESRDLPIRAPNSGEMPRRDFMRYHRENIFRR